MEGVEGLGCGVYQGASDGVQEKKQIASLSTALDAVGRRRFPVFTEGRPRGASSGRSGPEFNREEVKF